MDNLFIAHIVGPGVEVAGSQRPAAHITGLRHSSPDNVIRFRTLSVLSPEGWGGQMESREDCLHEAAEFDRLAELANTRAARALLAAAAFQWRKLAARAAERQKPSWPLVPEAVRPN
jgi:hypothetical protein